MLLEADVIYVSGLTFWFSMSRRLDFLTIERIQNRETRTVLKALTNFLALYNNRGIKVRELFVDAEFGSKEFVSALLRHGIRTNIGSA